MIRLRPQHSLVYLLLYLKVGRSTESFCTLLTVIMLLSSMNLWFEADKNRWNLSHIAYIAVALQYKCICPWRWVEVLDFSRLFTFIQALCSVSSLVLSNWIGISKACTTLFTAMRPFLQYDFFHVHEDMYNSWRLCHTVYIHMALL